MKKKWWKEAVGYQIYPRSFMDSNGDGIGDLRGIISKLDYLKELGIDIIWICPMYRSPNDDNGYDISDYRDILDEFGTMEDFDELLSEVHKRDMKLIIDLVINHTSDEHEWFIEASKGLDSPKRDWYIWKAGRDGREPNNWESIFSGSAWEKTSHTDEYYLHLFSKKQPDLNWDNEDMRQAIYHMINWWLDKGIDGFRVDAISHIKKAPGFPDMPNPENSKYVSSFDMHMNQPGIHRYLRELKENTFDRYDIVTVGEANGVSATDEEDIREWVGSEGGKFNMIFQFEHLDLWNADAGSDFDILGYKRVLSKWQNTVNDIGWNALYIENHDIPRAISSWGDDKELRVQCAKSFGAVYFLQKGTPFIYQGQEIGMTNVSFDTIYDYKDVRTLNEYNEACEETRRCERFIENLKISSRDNARTPMQWNSSKNAGFTQGTPWIGVNSNYEMINVESEEMDEDSILHFYRDMIKLRKGSEELLHGDYTLLMEEDENIYAYTRLLEGKGYIIICNLSKKTCEYAGEYILSHEDLILKNYSGEAHEETKAITLKPYECRVYRI